MSNLSLSQQSCLHYDFNAKEMTVLNTFHRAVVPRKCVFFSFMFVTKFADHCRSGYLSSPASSEIPLWFAVLMSSYSGPCALGVRSLLDFVQLHVDMLELATTWTVGVRVRFASAHYTTWFTPPHPHLLQATALNCNQLLTGLPPLTLLQGHNPLSAVRRTLDIIHFLVEFPWWLLIALGSKPKLRPMITKALHYILLFTLFRDRTWV